MPETEWPRTGGSDLGMAEEEFHRYNIEHNGTELTKEKIEKITARIRSLDKSKEKDRQEIEFLLRLLQGAKKI